ncbi:ABC transporter permease subunit [Streptomyces dysideae]|uniref:Uncharacterized protein n=1 Tax=Streptomyces dysideae TaxID=909626 RepID=A0A117S1B9_9ACTN|nr:ABC transporter permease subunit [Streptomyces dysideae]KUO20569.1 hypothetical protein AQJ91_13475 [Streptomyces dysideae]
MTTPLTGPPRAVLRLHRTALIVWGLFVTGTIAGLVWLNTVTADSARAKSARCDPLAYCADPFANTSYSAPISWISTFICYGFLAVAAWAGAALIGRELEQGTARLAWTQGVSPARWLAAKLAVPALVLTVGGIMLVVAFRWGWAANRDLMGDDWAFADVFVARGPATVAYALCALAVGTLTALLLRRALPALAVSLGAMWTLNFFLERYRESFWPTVTRTSPPEFEASRSWWPLENGAIIDGRRTQDVPYWECDGTSAENERCLDDLGITGHYTTYHPQSHYWPLHLVETGIVLTVAAVATLIAFRLLRRRTTAPAVRKGASV